MVVTSVMKLTACEKSLDASTVANSMGKHREYDVKYETADNNDSVIEYYTESRYDFKGDIEEDDSVVWVGNMYPSFEPKPGDTVITIHDDPNPGDSSITIRDAPNPKKIKIENWGD